MQRKPLAVIVLLIAAAAIWFTLFRPPFRRTLDVPGVVLQVRALSQLATVKYTIQQVVGLEQKREPLGSESILLLVQAKVLAGIDLAELTTADVQIVSRTEARIRLPPAYISELFIDEKNTKVWDRHITWWTPWVAADPDLEHRARLQALEQVRKEALSMGILRDAQQNAEHSIRALLQVLGVSKVTFVSPQWTSTTSGPRS